jgi:hypothetical protein
MFGGANWGMSLAKGYALETGQLGNVKRKSKAKITVINWKYAWAIEIHCIL